MSPNQTYSNLVTVHLKRTGHTYTHRLCKMRSMSTSHNEFTTVVTHTGLAPTFFFTTVEKDLRISCKKKSFLQYLLRNNANF